jgi:hypothetical protein
MFLGNYYRRGIFLRLALCRCARLQYLRFQMVEFTPLFRCEAKFVFSGFSLISFVISHERKLHIDG